MCLCVCVSRWRGRQNSPGGLSPIDSDVNVPFPTWSWFNDRFCTKSPLRFLGFRYLVHRVIHSRISYSTNYWGRGVMILFQTRACVHVYSSSSSNCSVGSLLHVKACKDGSSAGPCFCVQGIIVLFVHTVTLLLGRWLIGLVTIVDKPIERTEDST